MEFQNILIEINRHCLILCGKKKLFTVNYSEGRHEEKLQKSS